MAAKTKRAHRIAELIQIVVARLLQKKIFDPRLRLVAITGVDLSPDAKNAIVFFSLLDPSDENINSAEKAFQEAVGFFRFQLSRETKLRHTPKLNFKYDASLMIGERVSNLLKVVNSK